MKNACMAWKERKVLLQANLEKKGIEGNEQEMEWKSRQVRRERTAPRDQKTKIMMHHESPLKGGTRVGGPQISSFLASP